MSVRANGSDSARLARTGPSLAGGLLIIARAKYVNDRNTFSHAASIDDGSQWFQLGSAEDGTRLGFWTNGSAGVFDGPTLTLGTWYDIGLDFNTTTGCKLFYRVSGTSGAPTYSARVVGITIATSTLSLFGSTFGGEGLDGELEAVKIWTRPATNDAEILTELDSKAPVSTSSLWAYYPLDNAAGRATDSSGNSRNFTSTGSSFTDGASSPTYNTGGASLPEGPFAATTDDATMSATARAFFVAVFAATTDDSTMAAVGGPQPIEGAFTATTDDAVMAAVGDAAVPTEPTYYVTPATYLTGGTAFGGTGSGSLKDGLYGSGGAVSFTSGNARGLILELGPEQLLVTIGDEQAGGGDFRPEWNGGSDPQLSAFRIQVSGDTTTGLDGTWTTVATVTGWKYLYWCGLVPFTGMHAIRVLADSTVRVDELEVHDVTGQGSGPFDDAWFFLGDSTTNRATKRSVSWESFHEKIEQLTDSEYRPQQIGAGFVSWNSGSFTDSDNRIDTILADFPYQKRFCISLGTNDAGLGPGRHAAFTANMQELIDRIIADGRTVYLANLPYASDSSYGGPPNNYTPAFNTLIATLASDNDLPAPADLYTPFAASPGTLLDDGVHPNSAGCDVWNDVWADAMLADAYQTAGGSLFIATTDDAVMVATGTVGPILGTMNVTTDDASMVATGAAHIPGVFEATTDDAVMAMAAKMTLSGVFAATTDDAFMYATDTVETAGEGGGSPRSRRDGGRRIL